MPDSTPLNDSVLAANSPAETTLFGKRYYWVRNANGSMQLVPMDVDE